MAGDSIDMTARTYHTENGVAHPEGETYAVTDRVLAETLRGIGFVSIAGWTDAGPAIAPELATLTPASAALGAASVPLQVGGTGFAAGDVIQWDGVAVPTTVVSATEVTASIDLTLATAGAVSVTVQTTGGQISNALTFTITAAARRR